MKYEISVIIPTYNPDKTLEIALKSISDQTFKNREVLVIDDGSDSKFVEYLRGLQDDFDFRLICLDSNSGSCARPLNVGISESKAKYISICAQDDFYMPKKLEVQYKLLEDSTESAMVYSDCFVTYGEGTDLSIQPRIPQRRQGNIFNDLLLQKFYIPALTVMMRRNIVVQLGGFDERLLIEDWDMWIRISYHYPVLYVNEELACYRIHKRSLSQIRKEDMKLDRKKIIAKWKDLPVAQNALFIADFLDSCPNKKTGYELFYQWIVSSTYIRSPYRLLRILIGHYRSKYIH
jgi:alpha-1,3-rhamnosyltransferase